MFSWTTRESSTEVDKRRHRDRTSLWLQRSASIYPRTDLAKLGCHLLSSRAHSEVYNWRDLQDPESRPFRSDGEALIPAYVAHGDGFPRVLDGEFALVVADFRRRTFVVAVDVFGTKPLFFSLFDGVHVATYASALASIAVSLTGVDIGEVGAFCISR